MRQQHRIVPSALVALAAIWCLGFTFGPPIESLLFGSGVSTLVYQGICHQDPARSFEWFGTSWAVCHRCSAIYISFMVTALLVTAGKRLSLSSLPRPSLIVLLLLPVILDGLADLAGVWSATMFSRMITGGLTGGVLAVVILPVCADAVHKLFPVLSTSSPGGTNA